MSNIRRVAVSVVRAMLPTDTEDGIDIGSVEFVRLIDEHTYGEHFTSADLRAEVSEVLRIIETGRLNSDL